MSAITMPLRRRVVAAGPVPGAGAGAVGSPVTGLAAFAVAGPGVGDQLHAAQDALAERVAGDFVEAFGADCAGIAQAVREATGAQDLVARLQKATAGLQPHRSARIIEDVLAASAANGFLCSHATAGLG